jgi:hypothetical protein
MHLQRLVLSAATVLGVASRVPLAAAQPAPAAPTTVAPASTAPAAPAAAAPAAEPAATPPAAPEIVVTSEEVAGVPVRRGTAETVIRAPLEAVVQAMTDYGRYAEFLPHVRESRVVRRNRALTDVYLQVPINASLGVVWALLRVNARRGPNQVELVGESVDGNMDRFETRCVLERVEGDTPRTRMRFSLLALPRLPLPSSVFSREMANSARRVADTVRTRVERAHTLDAMRAAAPTPAAPVPPGASAAQ